MRQKDIALIAVLAIVSGTVAVFVSTYVFAPASQRKQKVEVVDVITSDFPSLPAKYFNANSIDPTQLIQIGGPSNPNPFNEKL